MRFQQKIYITSQQCNSNDPPALPLLAAEAAEEALAAALAAAAPAEVAPAAVAVAAAYDRAPLYF